MTAPIYPQSSDVTAGQATLSAHYNNLRADALRFGATVANAASLGQALGRYSQWVRLEYLAANKVRVPYAAGRPPALVVNGYILIATAHVDLAAAPSGPAALFYVFANRSAGSTTFTLTASTSAVEAGNSRLIGSFYWDGSNIDQGSVRSEELERPGYIHTGPAAEKSGSPMAGDIYIPTDEADIYVSHAGGTWIRFLNTGFFTHQVDGYVLHGGTTLERQLNLSGGSITFAFSGGATLGAIAFSAEATLTIPATGTAALREASNNFSASQYLNDTANSKAALGLTINQGDNDDEILALKSSDVTHGITDETETDTFGALKKINGISGGLDVMGAGEATISLRMTGLSTTDNTAKSTAALAPVGLAAKLKNGNAAGACGADANLVVIRNHNTARFIFDAEGSAHGDVEWVAFDQHDDVGLLTALEAEFSLRRGDLVKAGFGGFLAEHKATLQREKIVNFYDDGPRAMVNFTRLAMLHTGAIRKLADELSEATQQIAELKLGLPGTSPAHSLTSRLRGLLRAGKK